MGRCRSKRDEGTGDLGGQAAPAGQDPAAETNESDADGVSAPVRCRGPSREGLGPGVGLGTGDPIVNLLLDGVPVVFHDGYSFRLAPA
jgi:hypothetical protein